MSITKQNLDKENINELNYGIFVSMNKLIANAIYEAIICRNYPKIPVSINYMIRDIKLVCRNQFELITKDFLGKTFKNINELEKWIEDNLMTLDSFKQLNISNAEFKEAITVDSEERLRIDNPEEDDFIDLDAYSRNLAQDLLRDCLDIDYSSFYVEE